MISCENESQADNEKFNITVNCAAFDFGVYSVFGGSLCALGIVGNLISFSVLWRDNSKTATAYILRALAVADSLVLIVAMPLYVLSNVYPYTHWLKPCYDMYLDFVAYLWPCYLMPYTATIMLTVLVSLNRYFAVCRPYGAQDFCSPTSARKHVTMIAVFSILYNIPRFFEYEKLIICTGPNSTQEVFHTSSFAENILYRIIYANVLYFIVMHGGPLLSLAFLNYKLIQALKKRQRRRHEMGKSAKNGYQQDITLVLVVVIFVFMFCQTPTFVDHVLWTAVDEADRTCGNWHYYYTAIADLLAILNSSVNFLIYILTSRKFRQLLVTSCTNPDTSQMIPLEPTRAQQTSVVLNDKHQNHVNEN